MGDAYALDEIYVKAKASENRLSDEVAISGNWHSFQFIEMKIKPTNS